MNDISSLRKDFEKNPLLNIESTPENPFVFFEQWFEQTCQTPEIVEPNGFVLTTVDSRHQPSSRTVLLKYFDESGFVFFTNYQSHKGKDIEANNSVSMCFPWFYLERQILIEGKAHKISESESLKYFSSRPRASQIGAWVSLQSKTIESRSVLSEKERRLTEEYEGQEIPLPPFWGGYRVNPQRIEFWQGQPSRLHDRIQYVKNSEQRWGKSRLSP